MIYCYFFEIIAVFLYVWSFARGYAQISTLGSCWFKVFCVTIPLGVAAVFVRDINILLKYLQYNNHEENGMSKKIHWITKTAVMLALLVTLQALTKSMGQLVTGSCVNAVLAISVLVGGLCCGVTVAVISPLLAFLLQIAPQILTVPAIMVGNSLYVVILYYVAGRNNKHVLRQIAAWIAAAVGKFAALYAVVVWLICGVLSEQLLASGTLKPPMLQTLPATFSWPQLVTALVGGGVALMIVPVLRKALRKEN